MAWYNRNKDDERVRRQRQEDERRENDRRNRRPRNTGNFTRGSQLLGSQVAMFADGVRKPLVVWLMLFGLIHWLALWLVMGPHEVQLCSWRLIATFWDWADLSPYKPVEILLPSGSHQLVPMGAIPGIDDVASAWHKMWMTFASSFVLSSIVAVPGFIWYVELSNRRSHAMLDERNERGATLDTPERLTQMIKQHNTRAFVAAVKRVAPNANPAKVAKLPPAKFRALGLHYPYSLGGIPYPYGLEQSHTIVIGTTGSGKTTQLRDMVRQLRERGESAVIFDLTGAFVEAFYNPETDTILNPLDSRCPVWSIFDECHTKAEFMSAAAALIPNDGNTNDQFWPVAARTLFVEMCMKLREEGRLTNQALATELMTADLKRVHNTLKDTIADPITAPEAARMAESVRAVFNINAQALTALPTSGPRFSICQWVRREEKEGSILFVTSRHVDLELTKKLLTLWMDLAINTLMTLPRTNRLRTWFMFDELGALHRLPAIENGMQTARGFGGAFVLGLHSFARLKAIYGDEGAENLIGLARSKLILTTADFASAESCSIAIGSGEVRRMDEAYSYGHNSLRDASTLTASTNIERLVMPDQIMKLPSLSGYLVYPEGFPAAKIRLIPRDYEQVAIGFLPVPDQPSVGNKDAFGRERPNEDEGQAPGQVPEVGREGSPNNERGQGDGREDDSGLPVNADPPPAPLPLTPGVAAALPVDTPAADARAELGALSRQLDDAATANIAERDGDSRPLDETRLSRSGDPQQQQQRTQVTIRDLTADVGGSITPDHHHHHPAAAAPDLHQDDQEPGL